MAILGFEKLSKFAAVCSPWLFPIFIAGAVAMLPQLGVKPDFSNLWEIAETQDLDRRADTWSGTIPYLARGVLRVVCQSGHAYRTFGHGRISLCEELEIWVVLGIRHVSRAHVGVDLFGRDGGRYEPCRWIPDLMAFEAAGVSGVMAVVIAGWTTANPTLYRAGLALQSVTPNWPRWKITLAAGAVTSVLSCFPIFFMKLLDYVAIYGLILMPMGAIVLVEHWILPRIGANSTSPRSEGPRSTGMPCLYGWERWGWRRCSRCICSSAGCLVSSWRLPPTRSCST